MKSKSYIKLLKLAISDSIISLRSTYILALGTLIAGIGIGFILASYDASFLDIFIGESRIAMIAERASTIFVSPDLKEGIPGLMLFQLTSHNILLAGIAFIGGVFLGLISLYLLVYNALIMGVIIFHIWNIHGSYVFQSTVFLHGMIEILAFTVCVAAGFNIARALIIKKTEAIRKERLIRAFKDGVVLVLCMIPFFLLAGLVETFVAYQWPQIPGILNISMMFGYLLLFNALLFAYSWRQNGNSNE